MTSEHLELLYESAVLNLAKVKLIGSYNAHFYRDYPKNVPVDIQKAVNDDGKNFVSSLLHLRSSGDLKENEQLHGWGYIQAKLQFEINPVSSSKDFEQMILQQEWITYFAYLEAFFQDIARFIFSVDPSLLAHKQKTLTWEQVLLSGSYEGVIQLMIDETLGKSGYSNIADLIKNWNRPPFLMKIELDKHELAMLRWSISTRNIIIHNNSKVNEDYIRTANSVIENSDKTYTEGIEPLGSTLQLEKDSLAGLFMSLTSVVESVYVAVDRKYFPS